MFCDAESEFSKQTRNPKPETLNNKMKPSIPKGTRDFSPTEVAKRNYIFNTIRTAFENFGFQPIETPAFEKSSTLLGKYGDEGDRLIFKILNSGDYAKSLRNEFDDYKEFDELVSSIYDEVKELTAELKKCEKGLERNRVRREITAFYETAMVNTNISNFSKASQFVYNRFESFSESIKESLIDLVFQNFYSNYEYSDYVFKALTFNYYQSEFLQPKNVTPLISDKALRYDLTVPFARYVVQHQNEITFPFKRYQIQPVWRADRPQKGRFREFYQCDADVVGSKSLWQEVEFVQLYDEVFTKLGLTDTIIKINNRKILSGIAEIIGAKDKLIDFTVALDKLDKIGVEGITKEMLVKGISESAIQKLKPLFELSGSNTEKLSQLKGLLQDSDEGCQGVADLQFVIDTIDELGLQSAKLELDVTLARGLNYYTGAIFEVQTEKVQIGSIGGGGRYDDLTGVFGLKDVSGVGISFGLDRIYIVLEELGLFDEVQLPKPKVVFLNYDETKVMSILKAIKELRKNNIKCELYPDVAQSNKQQQKQWKYVVNRKIDYAVTDVEQDIFTLKNVTNGAQQRYKVEELIKIVQNS